MKVLLYIPRLNKGGPDRVFFELAGGFISNGMTVFVMTDHAGGIFWDRLNPKIIKRSLLDISDQSRSIREVACRFANEAKQLGPDIILCTLGSIFTATFARLLYGLRTPLVLRPANHLTRNAKELFKISPVKHGLSWIFNVVSLHVADYIVCQSEDLHRDFRRYCISKHKLGIIYNPISLPEGKTASVDPSNSTIYQSFRLLAVGRLVSQKGFDVLIQAIAILNMRLPALQLVILGDGPERINLERMIEQFGLRNRISLKGFADDISVYLNAADLLVSSSRYEGFPNVILEALSHGVPVIATDCPGGTKVMVEDGVTGWLCKPESPESLAATIEKAFSSPRFCTSKIRQFVEAKFETSKIVHTYADVLRGVVKRCVN